MNHTRRRDATFFLVSGVSVGLKGVDSWWYASGVLLKLDYRPVAVSENWYFDFSFTTLLNALTFSPKRQIFWKTSLDSANKHGATPQVNVLSRRCSDNYLCINIRLSVCQRYYYYCVVCTNDALAHLTRLWECESVVKWWDISRLLDVNEGSHMALQSGRECDPLRSYITCVNCTLISYPQMIFLFSVFAIRGY